MKNKLFIFFLLFFLKQLSFSQVLNLDWVRAIGGPPSGYGSATANSSTVDALGNVFTTGTFMDTVDFDPGPSVYNLNAPNIGCFITKYNSSGIFVWAKAVQSISTEAYAITLDPSGNILVTGFFQDTTDFDPGPAVYNLISSPLGTINAFVLKLDANGNFIWARNFGGTNASVGNSIVTDPLGDVYTTGYFADQNDFDPGIGTYTLTSVASDAFVSKLNSSGNFVWAKQFKNLSSQTSGGTSITIDNLNNLYITGSFQTIVDFDPSAGTYTLNASNQDAFMCKLNSSGSFVWAKALSGTQSDGLSIKLDQSNNVYTTGSFQGTVDFDPGIGNNFLTASALDVFVSKLDASGNFLWAKKMGSPGIGFGKSITLDNAIPGGVYVTGYFSGTANFDPGISNFTLTSNGTDDIFITKFTTSGNFIWAKQMGGIGQEQAYSICLDPGGNLITSGWFAGTCDFDLESGVYNITPIGGTNGFVHKTCIGCTTGFNSNSKETSYVTLFPNPTSGQFNLQFESVKQKTELKITNSLGQLILQKNISPTDKISLSISDQPSGIYFVEVNADGESFRTKVVKE